MTNNTPKWPESPYPESIFAEPTKEQFKIFAKILKENGSSLDKYSASIGRFVWKNAIDACITAFEEWQKGRGEITEQQAINEIEDYIGGNVAGIEDKDIDWMGLTAKLRSVLQRFSGRKVPTVEEIDQEIYKFQNEFLYDSEKMMDIEVRTLAIRIHKLLTEGGGE